MSGLYDNYKKPELLSDWIAKNGNTNYLTRNNTKTTPKWDSGLNADSVGSFWDDTKNFAGDNFSAAGFSDVANGLGGLYGMYQGHKMLGLYEDQINDMKANSALNRSQVARSNRMKDTYNNNSRIS